MCQIDSAVSTVVQITAGVPPTLWAIYEVGKILLGMLNSQQKRIEKALQGTKKDVANQLGFVNKVETEVILSFYSQII